MRLGQKILDRLQEIDKPQSELAKFLQINQAAVSQWKEGTNPARKRWAEIARFCGWASVDEMLAGTDEAAAHSMTLIPIPEVADGVDRKLLEFTITQLLEKLPAARGLPPEKLSKLIAATYAYLSEKQKTSPYKGVDSQDFSKLLPLLEAGI